MAGVPAEFVRVKAEPDEEHTADNRIVLLPEHSANGVRLHSFPNPKRDLPRFSAWVEAVGSMKGLAPDYIYKRRRVCHAHFELNFLTWSSRLSSDAVPTLRLPAQPTPAPPDLEPDENQFNGQVKVEEEEVKDELVCEEEPPGSDTGPCSPGPYSAQAGLAPELFIETQHREIERVKEEPCEEPWCSDTGCEGPGHYEQDETGLVPDHGQSTVDKVKVEEEEVKDESVCKEEPPGSDTGPCSPGPYSAQAELAPELYIETQHRVANQTGFTKNPLQKCEVQHMSISDQHRLPESQAQNAADQRMAVAGTPQDIDQVFECETCGKTFNQIFYFTSHMQLHEYNLKIVETKTKTYSCNSCGKQFETNKLLGEHELTHVTRDYREYSCKICGKTFSYMCQLTSHTRVHAGEKPYKCTMCSKRFAKSSSLVSHERTHTGQKPYVCNVCDMRFRHYSNLTRHRQTHTIRKKKFSCDDCGYQCYDNYSLTIHTRVHTGERPYVCEICGKKYTTKSGLITHGGIHSSGYSCDICKTTYSYLSSLKYHTKKYHS